MTRTKECIIIFIPINKSFHRGEAFCMEYLEFIWLAIIVIAIIVEASSVSLTSIWFAIGALAAWLFSLIFNLPAVEIIIFFAVSIILLIFTRPIAMNYLKVGKERTNADQLVGKVAIVVADIHPLQGKGRVRVGSQEWAAMTEQGEDIVKDTKVRIKAIKGVKLIVEKDS